MERDRYLIDPDDPKNVTLLPAGWEEYFRDEDMEDGPLTLAFCPIYTTPNSEVEMQWVALEHIRRMREVTREEAQRIHPALFAHIDALDEDEPEEG